MRAPREPVARTSAALAAALAVFIHAQPAVATCLPPAPVMPVHPDARHLVVMATAAADTVAVGWSDVYVGHDGRRPRRWRQMPVYGQRAHAARVAGPGAAGMSAGPVVLVPWAPGCGGIYRWYDSFAWLRPGTSDVVAVGRLRRREEWVDGVPTIDVLRTDLVKESRRLPGSARWTATPGEFFGLYATLPTREQIRADPWGAVAPMRAWLAANPEAARRQELRFVTNSVYRHAASAAARIAPSPLAGTYRVEVSRTGGPTHVVYMRTQLVPEGALFAADTSPPVFPAELPGYRLTASFARRAGRLPSPRPGWLARVGRGISGQPPEDRLEVWLPGARTQDGSLRFRGHLGTWDVDDFLFPDDPALRELIYRWHYRETYNGRVQDPVGELVLRPDGGVEIAEVMEVEPGLAVTIRATRISGVALDTPPDR